MVLHGQPSGTMKPCNFQEFLSFFSSRMLHRGPRLLLQLIVGSTLIFATLLFIRRGFGEDLSSTNPFKWTDDESDNFKDEKIHYEFRSQQYPGGLRVVVFGEDDVATPAWTRGEKEMRNPGWTEVMCRELKCSHYLSFIPPNLHPPAHTLISNNIYVEAVRQTIKNNTKLKKTQGPGYDYTFQPRLFPVSKALPDLSTQVTAFLDLQNTTTFTQANETLYVFNLGQWDVWSLATLPIDTSKTVIEQLTDHVIEQIERLYASSTLPNDTTSVSPKLAARKSSSKTAPMKIIDPDVYRPKAKSATTSPISSKSKAPKPKPDTFFRVLFPALFDISLAPGWNLNRPETPSPHSKAEQMRNAAKLMDVWNQVMGEKLYKWAEKSDDIEVDDLYLPADADLDTSLGGHNSNQNNKRAVAGQRKKAKQTEKGNVVKANKEKKELIRDFITYDMPTYLSTAMIEGQLRSSGLSDGNGLGQKLIQKWYKEVVEACVKPIETKKEVVVGVGLEEGSISNPTEAKGSKATAAPGAGGSQGKAAREAKPAGSAKRKEKSAVGKRVAEKAGGKRDERTETVCTNPDDHLFYTPFTLGARAIREIAKEAAEKVRREESYRQMGGEDDGLWKGVMGHI